MDEQTHQSSKKEPTLADQVGEKAALKLKARQNPIKGVWFGLGMMGLVGWSVAVPTLLGIAVGLWLDRNHPGFMHHSRTFSWTLAFLVAGLCVGCMTAWYWVAKEDNAMHDQQENHDE